MAKIEHIEERVFRPDREDLKSLIQKESMIRGMIYFIGIVGIICCILFAVNPSFTADFGAKVSLILLLFVCVGIFLGRSRKESSNENIVDNVPNKKYLLSIIQR